MEKQFSEVKTRRVINKKNGDTVGVLASRINYELNTYEVAISRCMEGDVFDLEYGKNLAIQRLQQEGPVDTFDAFEVAEYSGVLEAAAQALADPRKC